MEFLNTACKNMFCFLAEGICREFLYWFGIGQKCDKKDSKRGAVYVDQFIQNVIDDGRYKLHPFQLFSSFMGFDAWLGLISLRWEIKFGHGGISGLKTLRKGAVSSTIIKDLMHVNTSLRAGPLDFDSWVIFSFRGIEHVIFSRGTLNDIECLCDFIINLEKCKGESFCYLLVREIKGMSICVREGLGFLKWPVNLAIRLLIIFLKPFIRHAFERSLQKLVKDNFSNYKFQIQHNVEIPSSEESKENNARVMNCVLGGPQIAQLKRSNLFTSSYWCKSAGSYLRRKSPVLPKDYQSKSEHRQSIGIETKPIKLEPKLVKPNATLQHKISTAKNILELRSSQTEFKGRNVGGNELNNESNCLSTAHFSADYQTPLKEQTIREYTGIQYKKKNDNVSTLAKEVDFSSRALDVGRKLCQTISESYKIKESLRVPGELNFNNPLTKMDEKEKSKYESLEEYMSKLEWRHIPVCSSSNDKFVDLIPYSPVAPKSRKDSTAEVKRVEVEISGKKFPTVEQETENSAASSKDKTTTEGEVEKILQNKVLTTTTRELEAELSNKDGHRNIHLCAPFRLYTEDFVPSKEISDEPNFPLELKGMQSSIEKNIIEDKNQKKSSSNETSPLKWKLVQPAKRNNIPEKKNHKESSSNETSPLKRKVLQPTSTKSIQDNMQRENSLKRRAHQLKSPINGTEKKMHIESSLKETQSELKPMNLKSRPQDIPKQLCHFNTIEHATTTNVSVNNTTGVDAKEKLLKGEMTLVSQAASMSKEQLSPATLLLEEQIESTSATNQSVIVTTEHPKSIPENIIRKNTLDSNVAEFCFSKSSPVMKIHEENYPPKPRGLKPVNLKSRPDKNISKQSGHLKTKMEQAAATSKSVDMTAESYSREKSDMKIDETREAGLLFKEECIQKMLPIEAWIEDRNKSVDATTEAYAKEKMLLKAVMDTFGKYGVSSEGKCAESDAKEKLLKVVMGANCECEIFAEDGCTQKKRPRKAEIEDLSAENDVKEKLLKVEVDATCDSRVFPKEDCAQVKLEMKHVAATNESADVTAESGVEEKLLKVEMGANCECGISPKDGCTSGKRPHKAEIEHVIAENDVKELLKVEADATCEVGIFQECTQAKQTRKAEIENVAAINESVDVGAKNDVKEKFLKVEVDATCDSRVSPKEDCTQVKRSFSSEIEHVAATNESVDVTAENDIKEKTMKMETGATCESGISLKDECTQAKQTHEAEIENVAAINESVDVTAQNDDKENPLKVEISANCESGISPKDECIQEKQPRKEIELVAATIEHVDVAAEVVKATFFEVPMGESSESEVSFKDDWYQVEMPHGAKIVQMIAANEAEVTTGEEGTMTEL